MRVFFLVLSVWSASTPQGLSPVRFAGCEGRHGSGGVVIGDARRGSFLARSMESFWNRIPL